MTMGRLLLLTHICTHVYACTHMRDVWAHTRTHTHTHVRLHMCMCMGAEPGKQLHALDAPVQTALRLHAHQVGVVEEVVREQCGGRGHKGRAARVGAHHGGGFLQAQKAARARHVCARSPGASSSDGWLAG